MKNILALVFLVFMAVLAPSCSKKSGCPADSAQSKVDKDGVYKTNKTKSGLIPTKGKKPKKVKIKEI